MIAHCEQSLLATFVAFKKNKKGGECAAPPFLWGRKLISF
jgi:hypothetical protein